VLPFSNLQGWLPPFVLAPRRVLAIGQEWWARQGLNL
jgi:hypothetical protein